MTFKAHDRVRVKPLHDIDPKFYDKEGEVLGDLHHLGDGVILVRMDDPRLVSVRLDKAWIFIDPSRQLELLSSQPTIIEKPCHICSRINDSSVAVCYWCGNKPW